MALIHKVENDVIRKKFSSPSELKTAVYASLVKYLEDKEYLRISPFDATFRNEASLEDLDQQKISQFVLMAKSRRGFPLPETADPERILIHLNLLRGEKLTNAAILVFGKKPQRFFITSEIKCAQFYGTEIVKPIPAYQVYKGDVFQLVDQAVDSVLSRINARVGTRSKSVDAPIDYEIPRAALAEAIVNAVAHRDYTSNASVQVMLFRDRLEVWNPGQLPYNLTIDKLKEPHSSYPANPLLAEPMYLAGYIERIGTGIPDMINLCKNAGLKEPDFKIEDVFKTIIWRSVEAGGEVTGQPTGQVTPQATPQVTQHVSGEVTGEVGGEVTEEVRRILLVLKGEMKRADIQQILQLKHDDFFRVNYILPALNSGFVEMKYPDSPNHPKQKYRLTAKGKELAKKLKQRKKK